jgi:hypothetical protein
VAKMAAASSAVDLGAGFLRETAVHLFAYMLNEGQPVSESYLCFELNSESPQALQ